MAIPTRWRTLRTRIIVSDRWLTLRADTCETAEGVLVDPYYVVESPDFVVTAAITGDGQLVLVRQYRHAYSGVTLELPAGTCDAGEDPIVTSRRELQEETGYVGGSAHLIRSFSPNPVRFANRLHAVFIEGVSLSDTLKDDPAERIETLLWPVARAAELPSHPDFVDTNQIGVLMVVQAHLERGHNRQT